MKFAPRQIPPSENRVLIDEDESNCPLWVYSMLHSREHVSPARLDRVAGPSVRFKLLSVCTGSPRKAGESFPRPCARSERYFRSVCELGAGEGFSQ